MSADMTTRIAAPAMAQSPLRGILLKICSVTIFTVMGAILKATADVVPVGEQVFFRSLFAIPVILVWVALRGELRIGLRTHRAVSHFYRGIIGTLAMVCSFAGLGLLPLVTQFARAKTVRRTRVTFEPLAGAWSRCRAPISAATDLPNW